MTNNKIIVILIALLLGGTALIGAFPQTTLTPPANNSATTLQSPTFSQDYKLPSLLGMAIWATATPAPFTPTPTNRPNSPTPTVPIPTSTNVPNTPIPTTPPNPQPTPMTIVNVRPGRSLQEIAQIAEGVSCTPAAFILAAKTQETGQRFFTTSTPSIFQFYNTYGWWRPPYATAGDSCYGYSYNTITGLIVPDAVGAGTRCASAVGNQSAASQGIMGMMQLNQSEQDRATSKFLQYFRGGVPDRRVLFDAMVLAGIHYKSISTQTSGCNLDWSIRDIAIVSCKYYGACTDNYCENVCNYYAQYGGRQFNCGTISNLVAGSASGCVLR